MTRNPKALRCIAPDGEFITESKDFETIEDAWNRSNDMGSRWFFYPIHIVTGKKKILAVPDGMSTDWIGRNLDSLLAEIKAFPEEISDWIKRDAPCPV